MFLKGHFINNTCFRLWLIKKRNIESTRLKCSLESIMHDCTWDWCKGSINRPHTQTYFTFKISYRKKNSTCIFKFFIFIRLCSTVRLIFSVVSFVCYHWQRSIRNPVKHLRWSFLLKVVNYFDKKKFILDVWLVPENASDCYHCLLQYVPLLES